MFFALEGSESMEPTQVNTGILIDRVALITGGGGEIGGAIARRLASEGAQIMVVDAREAPARVVAEDISQAGGDAAWFAGDISDEAIARASVAKTLEVFGGLSILVNTAATITDDGTVETITLEQWNMALTVNLTAVFLMCKYAMPEIRNAGGGTVVNITSQLGQIGVPLRSPYSTTKAALMQFTKCLAVDYACDNIRANTLSPGGIDTERRMRRFKTREEARLARGPSYLLGRLGTVDEVASACLFLASNESSFVTGTDLLCDGGFLAFKGKLTDEEK
jgi:NAD(P)-dependent dehydrogenase (short-subunit alcohol dehydrogenase family)